jgi:cardiolipin synthase
MAIRRIPSSTDYTHRNKVCLVRGGHEYFETLESMINSAKETIHLQTYIYDDDETGRKITEALKKAAQRGVKVYLLVDAFASKSLGKPFEQEMATAGIHFRRFEPLLKSHYFYFGRRLHHKIVVTDAFSSLVAGVNISDRYNDLPGHPAWLDWALHVEGEASHELFKVCIELWYKSFTRARHLIREQKFPVAPASWDCAVKVRRNDWVHRRNQITRSYIEMLNRAEKHIIIMSSYFLPGRLIRRNIRRAADRGVKVSVMLAGESDISLAKNAERYIYRWLFKHKINVYEYPTKVLHGKLSTYDDKWVTLGSYNVNNISAYASVELNLDVDNSEFATSVQSRLKRIIQQECIQVTEETYATRNNFFHRTMQIISYEIVRLMIYLFTFYVKQRGPVDVKKQ